MTAPEQAPRCTLCGSTEAEHGERRHPFAQPGADVSTAFLGPKKMKPGDVPQVQQMQAPPAPFDPVLRQALIDKGVLTPDDLTAAEKKVFTISAGLWGGDRSDHTGPEQGQ